ncbi:zinc finger CCHC domain-containing protein 18-like [Brachyhypopomus gauderio]|uniref:zinc finger CCHC domain-containing protein 18-like n=1 Tax=Brachyhypopomus gauderio TaxID=698409 RepID=UPI0040429676
MDLCNQFDVHGPSSLYITGIDEQYTDGEIIDFFKVNGDVKKIVRVPDVPDQPRARALVEYSSERSILRLDPANLGQVPSPGDPNITWHVKTIREMCQEELGRELAQRCLAELSTLAGRSKAGFWHMLQRELGPVQPDAAPLPSPDTHLQLSDTPTPSSDNRTTDGDHPDNAEPSRFDPAPNAPCLSSPTSSPFLNASAINPPQVQKVIVEHFIRNEASPSNFSQSRVRTFSWRLPKPNGEVDYDAWRTQVDLLLKDVSLSDSHKVRRILESLLSPAADVVKPLGTNAPPEAYLVQLESAFGVVEDGEELFATFLGSNQNSGEKPSIYLNRLQTLLTKAISRGGVSPGESDKYLLRQFCRGCWDQSLIIGLQLEHRKTSPPSFPELLLLLRTEEDRRAAKMDRMKKHLGSTKAAAHVHSVLSLPVFDEEPIAIIPTKPDVSSKIEREVAELRKQVAQLIHKETKDFKREEPLSDSPKKEAPLRGESLAGHVTSPSTPQTPTQPKPGFCFKCGEDGHIAVKCTNEPNPGLVRKKNAELRDKRNRFWARQGGAGSSLNL